MGKNAKRVSAPKFKRHAANNQFSKKRNAHPLELSTSLEVTMKGLGFKNKFIYKGASDPLKLVLVHLWTFLFAITLVLSAFAAVYLYLKFE